MIEQPDGAELAATSTTVRASAGVGFAIAVVVVALNLRLAVASVGPMVDRLKSDLGLSSIGASVLTAVPVFCFGGLAMLGPWLARRLGLRRAVVVLLGAIVVGLVVRVGPDLATLFAGTVIVAGGIAAANVLLPVIIKREFPASAGLMMGLYTTAVVGSASAGAGLTVPISDAIGHGWRGGLGIWALAAAIALVLWLPHVRGDHPLVVAEPGHVSAQLRRDRLAWMVTAFFGLQSLSFYAVLSWLPSLYQDHGYSSAAAGGLLSVSTLVQIPVALVLPSVATRMRSQVGLVTAATALTGIGLTGLLVAPTMLAGLWVVILGIGQGATFTLALTLLVLRTRTHGATAQLSAMAQSIGYLFAGLGPLVVGALHSASAGWHLPIVFLLVLMVPQFLSGFGAGAPGFLRLAANP